MGRPRRRNFNASCRSLCASIFPAPRPTSPICPTHPRRPDDPAPTKDFSFDKKPRDVKAYLDRFVIKQEEAKKVLSVALCDHYHHVRLAREGKASPITPSKTSS